MVRQVSQNHTNTGAPKNIMYWWTGQVVDESTWVGNEVLQNHQKDEVKGYGKRYRVRIFSRDSEVKVVPDSQLDIADVVLPVTAGTGHGGYGETVCLSQGSWVTGWFLDGAEGRQPRILGCLPNNPRISLFGGDPEEGFENRTGYDGKTGPKDVAEKDIRVAEPEGENEKPAKEHNSADASELTSKENQQAQDGKEKSPRKKNIECEGGGGPVKGVQGFIQRALATIKRIQSLASTAIETANSILANISNITNMVAGAVASMFKMIVGKMRGFILNKINNGLKDVGEMLPPSLRQAFSGGASETTDTLACVFQKIMDTLFSMAKDMFTALVDNYVMAPMCAAEKMVGDMIGNILGEITGAVNSAVSGIAGLVGQGASIVSSAMSVLDMIIGLLNFLKCDSTPDCEYKDEWSFWDGSGEAAAVSEFLGQKMDELSQAIPGEPGPECNTSQLPCGPPGISFGGGGGSGLAGNLMMAGGQIMGVDFSSFGSGYTYTPSISITDSCGNGGGSKIELITQDGNNPTSPADTSFKEGTDIQIVGAVVIQPGSGYLDEPDGSTNISKPEDSVYRNPDGKYEVKKPDSIIEIPYNPDEEYDGNHPSIALPVDTEVEVFDPDGNVIQVIEGQGPTIPIKIPNGGTLTVPTPNNLIEGDAGIADFTGTAPVDPEINVPYTNVTTGIGNWEGFIGEDVRPEDKARWDGGKWRLIKSPRDKRPTSGGAKADIILDAVYIQNPGFNYQLGDVIVVEGGGEIVDGKYVDVTRTGTGSGGSTVDGEEQINDSNRFFTTPGGKVRKSDTGLKLVPVFNDIGQLTEVIIQDPGSTFSSYPDIYIKSTTGINANILPIFKKRTDEDPDENARSLSGDRIITVDDCIGRLVIGYVNGQPYYGPYHKHNGRKMVGRYHSPTKHAYIYDTPEESLRDAYAKPTAVVGNAIPSTPVEEVESPDGAVVEETQTSTVIQSTPTPTPAPAPTPTPTPAPTPTPTPTPPPSSGGSSGSGGGGGYGY